MIISNRMRDILIEHLDGPVAIVRSAPGLGKKNALRAQAITAMIGRGLLKVDDPGTARPRFTLVTDHGREILCEVLADWAEALIRFRRAEACRPRRSKRRPPSQRISMASLRAIARETLPKA